MPHKRTIDRTIDRLIFFGYSRIVVLLTTVSILLIAVILFSDTVQLKKNVVFLALMGAGIVILFLLTARWLYRSAVDKIKKDLDAFGNFLKKAAPQNEPLEENALEIEEFRQLARLANQVTARKKETQDELIRSRDDAEHATRAKSQFLANMSHEIRTPMNAIMGMGDILAQTNLNNEQEEYLKIISTSANNLMLIINDILNFSKIEAGELQVKMVNFSIHDVVEGVADMVAPPAHEKFLQVIAFVEPGIPDEVIGDLSHLHQLLLGLANNAVKFTERGQVFISARMEEEKNHRVRIRFEVKDTGIGISPEEQRHLFKSFSQVDTTPTRKYGGTGLGLAIARKLSELLKGEIGVESAVGKGSLFWFRCTFDTVKIAAPPHIPSTHGLKGLKVLIADNNHTFRHVLGEYLDEWGCTCREAVSAGDALEQMQDAAAQGHPFNLVLAAYRLPDGTAANLALTIQKHEGLKNTPIIFLTPTTAHKDHRALRRGGFSPLLYKPVKKLQLCRSVTKTIKENSSKANVTPPPEIDGNNEDRDNEDRDNGGMDTGTPVETPPSPPTATPPGDPLRILLVEDNLFNRKVALHSLKKYGHHVDVAENGQIAVDKFRATPYDIILMDIQMPVMDGCEATRIIRDLEKESNSNSHTPILAMTANARPEDEKTSLDAGMDAHLTKPFKADKFIDLVHQMAYPRTDP